MKRILIITLAVIFILIGIAFLFAILKNPENSIGGEKDEHGCLIPAGYSWNATEQECVREWVVGKEKYQVQNFLNCVDAGYPIIDSSPRQCRTLSGKLFVEEFEKGICVNNCGNGICEEIVCLAEGCPCAESKDSCSEDC